jgi:hypothetical protein
MQDVGESWADHLRQHERVTAEDREIEDRAQSFNLGPRPGKITHLIAQKLRSEAELLNRRSIDQ